MVTVLLTCLAILTGSYLPTNDRRHMVATLPAPGKKFRPSQKQNIWALEKKMLNDIFKHL
jgi:hypothetical protein